jgi:hypothetical protein
LRGLLLGRGARSRLAAEGRAILAFAIGPPWTTTPATAAAATISTTAPSAAALAASTTAAAITTATAVVAVSTTAVTALTGASITARATTKLLFSHCHRSRKMCGRAVGAALCGRRSLDLR